jgi:hypothetical protein
MKDHDFDDETLMAYADGEVEASTAGRIAQAAEIDAALADRIEMFRATRQAIVSLAEDAETAPLPQALDTRLRDVLAAAQAADAGETVVPLRQTRLRPTLLSRSAVIAASCAALGVLVGVWASSGVEGPVQGATEFATLDSKGVRDALSKLPAGARAAIQGGEIEVIASFLAPDNQFCREYEVDHSATGRTVIAVACRSADGWAPRFAVVDAMDDETTFSPASAFEALDAYLSSVNAGAPLSMEEEAVLLNELQP